MTADQDGASQRPVLSKNRVITLVVNQRPGQRKQRDGFDFFEIVWWEELHGRSPDPQALPKIIGAVLQSRKPKTNGYLSTPAGRLAGCAETAAQTAWLCTLFAREGRLGSLGIRADWACERGPAKPPSATSRLLCGRICFMCPAARGTPLWLLT